MTENPFFSIIVPVFRTPLSVLRQTINSVIKQSYPSWELILVDDASEQPDLTRFLTKAENRDSRIKHVRLGHNQGISGASNAALEIARGNFIGLLDHDDLLAEKALSRVADCILNTPEVDFIYSDEDKVNEQGHRVDAFLKPAWSPERLRGQMYTAHFSVYRTSLVKEVGGFRSEYDGSQDHDLALRISERARKVVHIPEILYHWRVIPGSTAGGVSEKPHAWIAGQLAVQSHLDRLGLRATADLGPIPGTYRVRRQPDLETGVSVIIPTRGSSGEVHGHERVFVIECIKSLLRTNTHRNLQIVIVYDTGTPQKVLSQLEKLIGRQGKFVEFKEPFNFSRKCNIGALHSEGEILMFLNDDTECISEESVGQLIAPLVESDVGMTGAMLLFEDGTIQHAGHSHHNGGFSHYYLGDSAESPGAFASLLIGREASGLTAACVAVPAELFFEVGGFTEFLPGNFNDVDFSKKIGFFHKRLVWMPNVVMHHYESKSRDPKVLGSEVKFILDRWGNPSRDPYLA